MPRTCATMTLHNALAQTSETYRANRRDIETFTTTLRRARAARRSDVVRIPLVMHVLHHTAAEELSDAQIKSQVAVLNRDFRKLNEDLTRVPEPFRPLVADVRVEFGLAVRDPNGEPTSGIVRRPTPVPVFQADSLDPNRQILELDQKIKRREGGGSDAWPRDLYLNVWVCHMDRNPLGYAQFPGGPADNDGVVIDYKCFGSTGTAEVPFDLGRTATHEIGHWLNLLHIWGDDGQDCFGSDEIEDTPNQAGPNQGTPSFPRVTCSNGPHGDLFVNYMDYTDDAGMVMFTEGQAQRMAAALNGPRVSILSSTGLTLPEQVARVRLPEYVTMLPTAAGRPEEVGTRTTRVFDGVSWV